MVTAFHRMVMLLLLTPSKMKKFCLSISLLLCTSSSLFAQQRLETLYLKNGSIIKGEVIEQIPGQSIRIRTKEGNVFVYHPSEVDRITKENTGNTFNSPHQGLDFNADLGYNIATKGGGGTFSAEIGLGKRFTPHFYWGVGTGLFIPTVKEAKVAIPLTSDFRIYFPISSSPLVPHGTVRMGYLFNTATGEGSTDHVMLQIMPGLRIPLTEKHGFNVAVGYTHLFATKGSGLGSGAVTVKTGFDFNPVPAFWKTKKVPTRDKGLQLTLEANTDSPWNYADDNFGYAGYGGALVVTYKMSPTLSFGLGYGLESFELSCPYEENGVRDEFDYGWDDGMAHNLFLRGQYHLNENKISPFVSCDLGMRFYSFEGDEELYGLNSTYDFDKKNPASSVFMAPAVGVSLRTSNNSYFEFKLGYKIAPKLSEKSASYEDRRGNTHTAVYEGTSLSTVFLKIGFTHTFKLLN